MNMKQLKLKSLGVDEEKVPNVALNQFEKAEAYQNKIKAQVITKLQMSLMKPGGHESGIGEWHREDKGVSSYMTTKLGGPAWKNVISRTTYDLSSGRIIEHLNIDKSVGAATLHRKLPPGVTSTRTVLHYRIKKKPSQSELYTRPYRRGGEAKANKGGSCYFCNSS